MKAASFHRVFKPLVNKGLSSSLKKRKKVLVKVLTLYISLSIIIKVDKISRKTK